jgi:hypothetical protein
MDELSAKRYLESRLAKFHEGNYIHIPAKSKRGNYWGIGTWGVVDFLKNYCRYRIVFPKS